MVATSEAVPFAQFHSRPLHPTQHFVGLKQVCFFSQPRYVPLQPSNELPSLVDFQNSLDNGEVVSITPMVVIINGSLTGWGECSNLSHFRECDHPRKSNFRSTSWSLQWYVQQHVTLVCSQDQGSSNTGIWYSENSLDPFNFIQYICLYSSANSALTAPQIPAREEIGDSLH